MILTAHKHSKDEHILVLSVHYQRAVTLKDHISMTYGHLVEKAIFIALSF